MKKLLLKKWLLYILIPLLLSAVTLSPLLIYVLTQNDDAVGDGSTVLATPSVTLFESLALWRVDENAVAYELSVDGELTTVANTVGEKILSNGQTLKVRAVGDGEKYLTSAWSNSVTYTAESKITLATPTVSVSDEGLATWNKIDGAVGYVYKINGSGEYLTTAESYQLSSGDRISVKALGDGRIYLDSPFSTAIEYKKPAVKLRTPVLQISDDGIASWDTVSGADGYVYVINGIEEKKTTDTYIRLISGMTVAVKAVSDSDTYLDSDFSETKKYEATPDEPPVPDTPTPEPNPEPSPENPNPDTPTNPEEPENPTPIKLPTPTVTVDDEGVASWIQIANVTAYAYVIDGGESIVTSSLSVTLADGQSISVKALGDGANYSDSDFSVAKTYIKPIPPSPDVLGVLASLEAPSRNTLPSFDKSVATENSVLTDSYSQLLNNHFLNGENYLTGTYPSRSDYMLYASPNDEIYIQLWIDNPWQYDILSLKVNGISYCIGENLLSFDVAIEEKIYTCAYIKTTVLAQAHYEMQYSVSDIEYAEGIYIPKDMLLSKNSVKIGLPLSENTVTASGVEYSDVTSNSVSFSVAIDSSDIFSEISAWLGFALFDGEKILHNQLLSLGNNTISITRLVENTEYTLAVYIYADLHDGNGVCAHILQKSEIITEKAISIEPLVYESVYSEAEGRYLPKITVKSYLESQSAEYIRLEVYDSNRNLTYTYSDFDGSAEISRGIFNGAEATVRIYYKDEGYPEGRFEEAKIFIPLLSDLIVLDTEYYSTLNDIVYGVKLGSYDGSAYPLVKKLKLFLYDKGDFAYLAEKILYLLDNPSAIYEAEEKYDRARLDYLMVDPAIHPEERKRLEDIANRVLEELNELRSIESIYKNQYSDKTDRSWWQEQVEKGRYYYEIEYSGVDSEYAFKVGDIYYFVLKNYYDFDVISGHTVSLVAEIDKNDGREEAKVTFDKISVAFEKPLNTKQGVTVKNFAYKDGSISYSLQNSLDTLGLKLSGVYKITLSRGSGELVLYKSETNFGIDTVNEDLWIKEYCERLKNGEKPEYSEDMTAWFALYEKYLGVYPKTESATLPDGFSEAEQWSVTIYTRFLAKSYSEEEYEAKYSFSITVESKLAVPEITFVGNYASFSVPNNSVWQGEYSVELKDDKGRLREVAIEGGLVHVPTGYKIRVKALGDGVFDDSDWSAWHTLNGEYVDFPAVDF